MPPPFLAGSPALLDDRFPLPLDGPFTTAEARAAGLRDAVLADLVGAGLLRRPLKGVYVAAQATDDRTLRGRILGRVAPPGSVVTDWTATWFWTGVDHPGSRDGRQPLTVFRFRGHQRLRNPLVLSGERWLRPSDVVPIDGNLGVTTPLRTVHDLGRFSPGILALGGMDTLSRAHGIPVAEILDGVERFRRQRGVVQLRRLAGWVDPRSESTGESGLRYRWLEVGGLPPPELQIPVLGSHGLEVFRLDLGVEALRLAAEYDGELHHTSEADRAHDAVRRRVLQEEHGWTVEVFTREGVYGARQDATARLVRAVTDARVRCGRIKT